MLILFNNKPIYINSLRAVAANKSLLAYSELL